MTVLVRSKALTVSGNARARELSAKLTEGVKLSRRERPAAHDFPCPLRSKGEAVCGRRGLFLPLFEMCNLEKGNGLRRITFLFVQKSNQKTHLEGWLTRPKTIGLAAERNCALRACFNGATLPSKNSRGRRTRFFLRLNCLHCSVTSIDQYRALREAVFARKLYSVLEML